MTFASSTVDSVSQSEQARAKSPPKFVPTLTEVVKAGAMSGPSTRSDPLATPVVGGVANATTGDALLSLGDDELMDQLLAERLTQRMLQQLDLELEHQVRQTVNQVVSEHVSRMLPVLRAELEHSVHQAVRQAVQRQTQVLR